jgi:hypothetical protein
MLTIIAQGQEAVKSAGPWSDGQGSFHLTKTPFWCIYTGKQEGEDAEEVQFQDKQGGAR